MLELVHLGFLPIYEKMTGWDNLFILPHLVNNVTKALILLLSFDTKSMFWAIMNFVQIRDKRMTQAGAK